MIHLPEHVRLNLPTAQEVGAHVLFFFVVWGCLGLIILECLP
ncbi:hypothetical protein [Komagataeibacter europaeus]|nr:hypothetical protein [Komagataeibacter europaeus]